jgi:hypothetical protein
MNPEYINSIAALFTAVAVMGVMLQGWFIKKAITDVAVHTNSIKDELVAEVRLASFAKGQLAGKEAPTSNVSPEKDSRG